MSLYSNQVTNVLDGTLIPKMKRLVSSIALIEPYTIDSEDLKRRYDELSYLSMVYDYLHEYELGNEEMDDTLILNAIRLVGNVSINLQPEVFDPATNTQTQGDLFDVLINGEPFTGTAPIGYHDLEVTYNGTCSVTKIIHKQKMVGAPGNKVFMHNTHFGFNDYFEFRAYGNNNILLTSAQVFYTTGSAVDPDNGLGTTGLPVTIAI